MATSPVNFSLLDPSVAADQAALQRNMDLAAALRKQSLTPIDTNGRMAGRLMSHVSWTEGIAKLMQAQQAGNLDDSNDSDRLAMASKQSDLIKALVGGGATNDATASTAALSQGAAQGSVGPTNDNAVRMGQILAQGNGGAPQGGGMSVTGDPKRDQLLMALDPDGYMQSYMKRFDPTDTQRAANAAGLKPGTPEYGAAMQQGLKKQNYIAPVSIRSGGGVMDPSSGNITTMPAAAPPGYQAVQQNGQWGYVPVQGGTQAVTASTDATERGKAPFGMVEGFDPVTKAPFRDYAGNHLALPPGAGQGVPPPQPPPAAPAGPIPSGMPPPVQPVVHHYPTEASMAGAALSDIGADPKAIERDIAMTRTSIDRVSDEPSKQMLREHLADMERQRANLQRTNPQGTPGIQTGPALGSKEGATNAQNELSTSWTQQQSAHQTAQTNVAILNQMRDLSDRAITGYEPDRRTLLTKLGAYVGIPGMDEKASATDLYNKYGSQLITGLAQKGGMSTDAARDLVAMGSPNSHMQPAAAKEAIDGLVAREQLTQARTEVLRPYATQRDPVAYQNAATTFDKVADPRVWQWMSIKDPKAKAAFAAKVYSTDPSFPGRITTLEKLGVLNGSR